ncbi:MAG: sulfotransferase [Candidatus Paceibacterota bacterium]
MFQKVYKAAIDKAASRIARNGRLVFVLSTGRVGTVSLIRALSSCEEIDAFHEPHPHSASDAKAAYLTGLTPRAEYVRVFEQARSRRVARTTLRGRIYFEATNMIYFAPLIAEQFPRSQFLFVHRHPGCVVRSAMRRRWFSGHPWDEYRICPRAGDPALRSWPTWSAFEKNCWLWSAVNEFILELGEDLPSSRFLSLSFQELFGDDANGVSKLLDFVGARSIAQSALTAELAKQDNQQQEGHFLRFDDWTPPQKLRLHELAGGVMRRLGYY